MLKLGSSELLNFLFSFNLLVLYSTESAICQDRGEQLFKSVCAACHSINPPPLNAPPVRGIVMNYSAKVKNKQEFLEKVASWAEKPELEKSHMPGAITKFGIMPALPLPKNDLMLIAGWMWDQIKGAQGQVNLDEETVRKIADKVSMTFSETLKETSLKASEKGSKL